VSNTDLTKKVSPTKSDALRCRCTSPGVASRKRSAAGGVLRLKEQGNASPLHRVVCAACLRKGRSLRAHLYHKNGSEFTEPHRVRSRAKVAAGLGHVMCVLIGRPRPACATSRWCAPRLRSRARDSAGEILPAEPPAELAPFYGALYLNW
jgi:hypothetical protein